MRIQLYEVKIKEYATSDFESFTTLAENRIQAKKKIFSYLGIDEQAVYSIATHEVNTHFVI